MGTCLRYWMTSCEELDSHIFEFSKVQDDYIMILRLIFSLVGNFHEIIFEMIDVILWLIIP